MRHFFLLSLTCLVAFSGCARREDQDDTAAQPAAQDAGAGIQPVQADADARPTPITKVVAGVEVVITLSPAAEADLRQRSETILVEATYAGDPTPESAGQTDEFGLVQLGSQVEELQGAGRVSFGEELINKSRLDLISGQPQLLINVRSGRKSVQNNLLACPLFWNSVEAASQKPVEIACVLRSELPPEN